MHIEIINTGTELMLGQTANTHGTWLGRELFRLGLRVAQQCTVPDGEPIAAALRAALARGSEVILLTGGLGPTSDDLSREITAEVLGLELIEDAAALRELEAFFARRNRPMAANNRKQALVPVGAELLPNPNGTAPGIYVPARLSLDGRCAIFLLPGPPRELYPMFLNEVEPRLRAIAGLDDLRIMQELKFTGVGESDFHQQIDHQLAAIADLEYGYCARISEVDLRLIGPAEAVATGAEVALAAFADCCFSRDGSSLESTVLQQLRQLNWKLATAESCTGGLVASRLTDVAGASAHFTHGWITYANEAKIHELGVNASTLSAHGAVSEEVARAMAEGALQRSGADIAVAITGIAGPSGGSASKPVGTAWVAVASKVAPTQAWHFFQPRERIGIKQGISQAALDAVRRTLQFHIHADKP